MRDIDSEILEASKTAFIDKNEASNFLFKPTFLYNDYKKGTKVLSSIKTDLINCKEFFISVAFITESGITPLLQDLKELENRGIPGKILTTDYLYFTEPKALQKLNELENIEVRMYNSQENHGLHTKGYLFKKDDFYRIILGSSNMTSNALTVNKEWNMAFSSLENGEIANDILEEFKNLWDNSISLNDCLEEYNEKYTLYKRIVRDKPNPIYDISSLKPNSMQKAFIESLNKFYENDENRALLISATGTGKTYAAAFALKEVMPKRMLFLVHREQIAKQALNTFKTVFNQNRTFGLLSGNEKNFDKDYLFSTVQMMQKEDIHQKFAPDYFDYIIIDEVHRAGANTYQKIMNYFNPKFYLGMTASPDRSDGFDIYGLFDHNIAYEIRLKQALENELLCPFHYFGIKDVIINDEEVTFSNLTSDKRVEYIIEKAKYFGFSGSRVKGLIFCSTKKEAKELSLKFNEKGLNTIHLSGENSQDERLDAIERLTTDTRLDKLDYIFTVDIFNEGVDIPEINQVIMLRETQSPIVFIQQLGRGLRKAENKEYVVVLDFIGNYKNNFMIPIALSGDRTYNKDNLRKYLMEGTRVIPGNSTINFDEVSKEKIYKSIDSTNLATLQILKEKYNNLKFKLGKIPTLMDFYEIGEIDPILILQNRNVKTYYTFLKKYDADFKCNFSNMQVKIIEFISSVLADGKRPHELLILKSLINNHEFLPKSIDSDEDSVKSAINILNLGFNNKDKEKFEGLIFFDEEYKISKFFLKAIEDDDFRVHILDLINYSLAKFNKEYSDNYEDTNLVLYQKYSRRDICRILNWPKDESSVMYGYKIKYGTCPIFVTYKKSEDISDSTKYEDKFINHETFSWMTRSKRTLESNEIQPLVHYDGSLDVHLFIKKSDGEGTDFYYMGKAKPTNPTQTKIASGNDLLDIVNFKLKLNNVVREDIYHYLTN